MISPIFFPSKRCITLPKTFDISIELHGDCCSVFLPKNPATKARLEDILLQEKKLGMEKWVEKIIKNIKY